MIHFIINIISIDIFILLIFVLDIFKTAFIF